MTTKTKLQLGLSAIALFILSSNCLASSDIPLNGGVLQPGQTLRVHLDELLSGYYYNVECVIKNTIHPNERVYIEYVIGNTKPGDQNTEGTRAVEPGYFIGWPHIRSTNEYIQIKSLDYSDPILVFNCKTKFNGARG